MTAEDIRFTYTTPSLVSVMAGDTEVAQIEHKGDWRVSFNPSAGWIDESVLKRVVAKIGLLNLLGEPRAA